jgi:hypothetical protein
VSTVAERVAAGAAFLDEHDPGWWREDFAHPIDVDRLWLGDCERCIFGQLRDDYNYGLDWMYGLDIDADSAELGFMFTWSSDNTWTEDDDIDALTAEWKRVILERRAVVSA